MTAALQVVLSVLVCAGGELYHWPLDLPRAITSSFGEYRAGRFHVGIDLRTGDPGKAVHAAGDGYISRVRCSPEGYGKAAYLRLDDGNTVVYAHLDQFAEPVAEYVRRAQHARQSYTVDLYPEPGAFPVTRGQIIARSGATGEGPPHLHYELRDGGGHPMNPRRIGITWPDTTPPVIRQLLIAPADPASTVNGDIVPIIVPVRRKANGEYFCNPVHVSGQIGLGVDVIDPANHGASTLGVYVVRTCEGARELFRVQHDSLPYNTLRHGTVAYHPFFLDEGPFLLQWRWPGNESESFQHSSADGWYDVPDNPVDLHIETEDFAGNRATAILPLIPDGSCPVAGCTSAKAESGTVRLDCLGTSLVITAAFTGPESDTPELTIIGPSSEAGCPFRRINDTTFRAGYLSDRTGLVTLRVVHDRLPPYEREMVVCRRGSPDETFLLGEVSVHGPRTAPYGTLFIMEETLESLPMASTIRVLGKPYRIWPDNAPIDAAVELVFPTPAGAEQADRVHVYQATKEGWEFFETERNQESLRVSTRKLGVFMAMEDDKAPVISGIEVGQHKKLTGKRPTIRATVTDEGSGIADIALTCGKKWLLAAYDPEDDRVEWEGDEDLPSGTHHLTFRATDKAGNVTEVTRRIAIPR